MESLSRREVLQMLAVSSFFVRMPFRHEVERFPRRISITEALDFHQNQQHLHDVLMVVAAGWRSNPEAGEEDWFEELCPDLERVTFQMPDGLPILAVHIDTDMMGGAVITMGDLLMSQTDEDGCLIFSSALQC